MMIKAEWTNDDALSTGQTTQPNDSNALNALDCISRQAAIRWVKTECNPYGKPTLDFESGKKVIAHLKQMPSAEKKAKILNASPVGECSACGWLIDCRDGFNYCPGCGARLEGDNG